MKDRYTHIEWHLLLFNWSRSWTEDKIMKTWCLPRGRAGYLPLLLSKNCSCQWVNCKIDNDGNSRDNGSNLYLGEVSLSWPSSHPLFPSRSFSASSRWPGLADQTDGRASSRQEVLDLKAYFHLCHVIIIWNKYYPINKKIAFVWQDMKSRPCVGRTINQSQISNHSGLCLWHQSLLMN